MRNLSRKPKRHEVFILDDRYICKILADMTIYDYVPALASLQCDVLRLNAFITKLRETTRGAFNDKVRDDYKKFAQRFRELLQPADYDELKTFLRERKRIDAGLLLFDDSPY